MVKEYSKSVLMEMQVSKFKGCSNICPKCNKRGDFGSILRQMEADGTWWMVCGWCNSIIRTPEYEPNSLHEEEQKIIDALKTRASH